MALGADVTVIQGNADRELVSLARGDPIDIPDEVSPWAASQLSPSHVEFLAGLPPTAVLDVDGFGPVLFCHAPSKRSRCGSGSVTYSGRREHVTSIRWSAACWPPPESSRTDVQHRHPRGAPALGHVPRQLSAAGPSERAAVHPAPTRQRAIRPRDPDVGCTGPRHRRRRAPQRARTARASDRPPTPTSAVGVGRRPRRPRRRTRGRRRTARGDPMHELADQRRCRRHVPMATQNDEQQALRHRRNRRDHSGGAPAVRPGAGAPDAAVGTAGSAVRAV
ncbi:Diadenosine tetraphosphatase related serine/threonine protein phosphatase [Pseudonocardia sp. Ae707_Ps1]|nr:Diadenosine tetraphosphatase related serine/threonine protein phosphatase [Pseudonocardia sp. Ae707_Ps1]